MFKLLIMCLRKNNFSNLIGNLAKNFYHNWMFLVLLLLMYVEYKQTTSTLDSREYSSYCFLGNLRQTWLFYNNNIIYIFPDIHIIICFICMYSVCINWFLPPLYCRLWPFVVHNIITSFLLISLATLYTHLCCIIIYPKNVVGRIWSNIMFCFLIFLLFWLKYKSFQMFFY